MLLLFICAATVVNSTVRSAFEYQGQKCSACSRMYIPDTLWPQVCNHSYPVYAIARNVLIMQFVLQIQEGLVNTVNQIKMGSVSKS